jgi:hypothetical protein
LRMPSKGDVNPEVRLARAVGAKLPHSGADEGFALGLKLVLDGLAASIPAPHRPTAPPPG